MLRERIVPVSYPKAPAHIEPFVRVLGPIVATEFLMTFGGADLYLTPTPKSRSRLVGLVGHEKAAELAEAAAHLPRRIPTAKPWVAAVYRAQGLPVAEIARKLHVSDVTVRAYLKRYRTAGETSSSQPRLPGF